MSLPGSPVAMERREHFPTSQPQKSKVCNDRKRERSMEVNTDIENTSQKTAKGRYFSSITYCEQFKTVLPAHDSTVSRS